MKIQGYILTFIITCGTLGHSAAFQVSPFAHPNGIGRIVHGPKRSGNKIHGRIPSTHLNELSEWRDLMFEPPGILKNLEKEDYQEGPMREVCILPFPLNDALLQGETKELCLYEERFHKLFEKATKDHGGVVAMGLLSPPAGIIQTMPLCEVESFKTMVGDTGFGTSFSIFATIRAVGRASLIHIQDDDSDDYNDAEFLVGWCTEMCDDTSSNNGRASSQGEDVLQSANDIADKVEEVFDSIIDLEQQLSLLGYDGVSDDAGMSEATMKRRLLEAELEAELDDEEDDEDEDDEYLDLGDDDDDDDALYVDIARAKLQKAIQIAKSCDMQGYRISSMDADATGMRSVQDLTALSWALFSWEEEHDAILRYRLGSLEIVDLYERLKLALVMMMERRSELKEALRSSTDKNED